MALRRVELDDDGFRRINNSSVLKPLEFYLVTEKMPKSALRGIMTVLIINNILR